MSIQIRCGHDGQRKRVAHMPTATTTTEDSRSNLVQNHPHDFTMKRKRKGERMCANFAHAGRQAIEPPALSVYSIMGAIQNRYG
jgi:hypothetical protein